MKLKQVLVEDDCTDFRVARNLEAESSDAGYTYRVVASHGETLGGTFESRKLSQMKSTVVVSKKGGFTITENKDGFCDYFLEFISDPRQPFRAGQRLYIAESKKSRPCFRRIGNDSRRHLRKWTICWNRLS
ncbi:MAG: hypothetical protein V3S89_04280 [Desulfobacterales bacterium]